MRTTWVHVILAAAGIGACQFNGSNANGGGAGMPGGMQRGGAAGQTTGTTPGGPLGGGGSIGGDGSVVETCTPGLQGSFIADCGYPSVSNSPLTSVTFNEDEVLRAIQPATSTSSTGIVRVFYNDEHALTLGVRSVVVKSAGGTSTTDFPVSALPTDPGSAVDPQTGTNELVGNSSGLDASLRPMWPALFLTDITADPNSRVGDWQHGGVPIGPNAVFGSWKSAVRTLDTTRAPSVVTITPDADPAKNNWSLADGDPVPAGLTNQGYGAEVRWNVPLVAGHSYRLQVVVHDGDQNKAGGDSGEACVVFCAGGGRPEGGGGSGGTKQPMCPAGTVACIGDGVDPASCPAGNTCVSGCCLPVIP